MQKVNVQLKCHAQWKEYWMASAYMKKAGQHFGISGMGNTLYSQKMVDNMYFAIWKSAGTPLSMIEIIIMGKPVQ